MVHAPPRRAAGERRLRPPPDPPLSAGSAGRVARIGHLAVGAFLTSRLGSRLHLALHRMTGGRAVRTALGFETVVLTTTGRRSGRAIDAPLTAIRDDAGWIVIASNGGKERPPAWLLNLRADPRARLAVGRDRLEVTAREATPEEHDRWWPEVVRRYAGYRTYRERTTREIPLVLLRPAAPAGAVGEPAGDPAADPAGDPAPSAAR